MATRPIASWALIAALTLPLGGAESDAADAAGDVGGAPAPPARAADQEVSLTGKVIETMDVGSYTYLRLDTGKEKHWAAAPRVRVAVGDTVSFEGGLPMVGYHSKTLDRTFEVVYFVPGVRVESVHEGAEPAPAPRPPPAPSIDLPEVEKAADGRTVGELFADRAALSGREVVVRGKVVKVNSRIMGRNWLHVRDGTGEEGSNDLTVTTTATARVGDTVLVRGVVTTDKDFGAGYRFDVIIEDARVTVE